MRLWMLYIYWQELIYDSFLSKRIMKGSSRKRSATLSLMINTSPDTSVKSSWMKHISNWSFYSKRKHSLIIGPSQFHFCFNFSISSPQFREPYFKRLTLLSIIAWQTNNSARNWSFGSSIVKIILCSHQQANRKHHIHSIEVVPKWKVNRKLAKLN